MKIKKKTKRKEKKRECIGLEGEVVLSKEKIFENANKKIFFDFFKLFLKNF